MVRKNLNNFYGVAHGRIPGVYDSWPEAQEQIKGYPLPIYKAFIARADAEKFVKDRQPESYQMDVDESASKFYAIARGRVVGVFTEYSEVVAHSRGSPNMLFKKFDNLDEAREYIRKYTTPLDEDEYAKQAASRHRKKGPIFYGVAIGRETGVYQTWEDVLLQTKGYPSSKVRKFATEEEAQAFVDENKGKAAQVKAKPPKSERPRSISKPKKKKPKNEDDGEVTVKTKKASKKSHHSSVDQEGIYAVAHGKIPGVYYTWAEVQEQIKGYPLPIYKRCTTKEDAEQYVSDRQPESYHMTVDDPNADRFYAIARGRVVGIFTDYSEVIQHSRGSPNMLWKKFDTLEEAREYIDKYKTNFSSVRAVDSSRGSDAGKSSAKKKLPVFYGVASGHRTGVFNTWEEVLEQTKGYKGAKVRKFTNEEDAVNFSLGLEMSSGSAKRNHDEVSDEEADNDDDYEEPSPKKAKKHSSHKKKGHH